MEPLTSSQKWELKAHFYLSLIHQAIMGLGRDDSGFQQQAAMLNRRVRLVVHKRTASRAWSFSPEGVIPLGMDDPVDLTLTFESNRLFVKVVEERSSPLAAVLFGSISVDGPLNVAYSFVRMLSAAGHTLSLLRRPPHEGEEALLPLAHTALFFALFNVLGRYIVLRDLPHPGVPWQMGFAREGFTIRLQPGPEGPSATGEEGLFTRREGAGWRLRKAGDLKRVMDHPLAVVGILLTGGLRISGWTATVQWVKVFIPFVKEVAPLLQSDGATPGETDSPSSTGRTRPRRSRASRD